MWVLADGGRFLLLMSQRTPLVVRPTLAVPSSEPSKTQFTGGSSTELVSALSWHTIPRDELRPKMIPFSTHVGINTK